MGKSGLGKQLLRATDGLIGAMTDLTLILLWGALSAMQPRTTSEQIMRDAQQLYDAINYHTIKRALANLVQAGLIKRSRKISQLEVEITQLGKKRLEKIFPAYHEKRPWDGHIYLISYDIPVRANKARNLLREYIRRTGGALLQESLWINPYNPTVLLDEFVHKHRIPGTVLVSKLGRDGAIGEESFDRLLTYVYHLDTLAERYEEFIEKYKKARSPSRLALTLDYYTILKTDPQLPFDLLPKNFPALRAHALFQKFFKR